MPVDTIGATAGPRREGPVRHGTSRLVWQCRLATAPATPAVAP